MTEAKQRVCDAHAHIFPAKIAEKASKNIGKFYEIPMRHPGLAELLLERGSLIGTEKYLVSSVATRADQVEHINDFLHGECAAHSEFIGLCTLHPEYEDNLRELDRAKAMGFAGLKLHPDFQLFDIDDEKMLPVFRRLAEYRMPVLFHMGDDRYDYSAPARLVKLMEKLPELTVIAAHFGGYRCWAQAKELFAGANLWYDTSSSLFRLTKEEALELMDVLGTEQMLFGTDYPMWDPVEELERFRSLGLPAEQEEAILHLNFKRLFAVE